MSTESPTSFPFPHEKLTKIEGEPTAATVRVLKREVYANAMAIATNLGGGNHGYLGMVMPAVEYNAMNNTQPFVAPNHPGAHPGHANGATAAAITETNRVYLEQKQAAETYAKIHAAIKQQILDAVGEVFLMNLQDELLGYANVSAEDMLQHLSTTYGTITPDELDANKKLIEAEWNPDDPIETLWKRIQDAQRFAQAGNDPMSDNMCVRATLTVLEKSGVFTEAIRDWRKRPAGQWTLDNLKADFNAANKERLCQLTARTAGYHTANHATNSPPEEANATANGGTPHIVTDNGVKMYYCWTHGLGKNPKHTSETCKNKAEGHKDKATADKMMGGNNTIMGGGRRTTSPSGPAANAAQTQTTNTE